MAKGKLVKWVDKYQGVCLFFGLIFMFVGFSIAVIRMPSDFRQGIYPRVMEYKREVDELKSQLESFKYHTHRYYDGKPKGVGNEENDYPHSTDSDHSHTYGSL